ncbi:hypothetical protein ABIF24_000660 [Bradyrhizobium elkanii]
MCGVRHQLMIGRMKLDLVAAIAPGIEQTQLRRVLVGNAAALRHGSGSPMLAEIGQLSRCRRPAIGGNRRGERRIHREQVDIFERRRLVEDVVGGKRSLRHGLLGNWSIRMRPGQPASSGRDHGPAAAQWNRRIISLRAGAGQRKVQVCWMLPCLRCLRAWAHGGRASGRPSHWRGSGSPPSWKPGQEKCRRC